MTLHNVVGDSQNQNGGLIVAGVALDGTVHDVVMDHVTMRNNYGRGAAGDYWNGDGFVAERGTYNLTFRDTVATGNTDSGYDIKGNNVTMLRASASGNNKNFRLWGAESVTMTDSVSTNPHYFGGIGKPSHFQAASGANVTLDNFRYSDSSTVKVFDLSNGGNAVRLVGMALPSVSDIHFGNNSVIRLPNGLVVNGTSAADVLAGGTGSDMLIGGQGNDTYTVNNIGDRPVEQGGEGTDLVKTTLASYTLGAHVEKLSYSGAGNFSGTGNNPQQRHHRRRRQRLAERRHRQRRADRRQWRRHLLVRARRQATTPSTTAIPAAPTGCCSAPASPRTSCGSARTAATCW